MVVDAGLLSNLGQIKLKLLLQFFYIDWPEFINQSEQCSDLASMDGEYYSGCLIVLPFQTHCFYFYDDLFFLFHPNI